MNEGHRERIKGEIELLVFIRERISKLRDDQDRVHSGNKRFGDVHEEVSDVLSEVGHILLMVIGKLDRVKKQPNVLETHK